MNEQPYRQNPLLRLSYSLIAPLYDSIIERPMREMRKRSLAVLSTHAPKNVLISGVGTGLDLPHLPRQHHYTALDFNAAMLSRAKLREEKLNQNNPLEPNPLQLHLVRGRTEPAPPLTRGGWEGFEPNEQSGLKIDFILGDSMNLPCADAQFDFVVLHLILAVVPEPQKCLREAARVLKPGGTIILFDKFLHPHQGAPMRRLFNIFTRRFATRMDVVFEEVLRGTPGLQVVSDVPLLAGGWFRGIVLRKPA